ncbi:uncharacterized protein LOC135370349 [Ornithodoros turicata]|uniref:uncharacterized protein LOC135370349 n=1 Tax=Ornithodoros turicata TaxID=34597 RepID=UPI0031396810
MGEEEGTPIVGLRKHQGMEWERKKEHRKLASENTKRWNGRGRRDADSWSQKTPRGGMGEEEGTAIVGLRKHPREWESNKEHRKLASENKRRWNGRRGANSWSQKTPRVGMGEEEGTPIVGLRKHPREHILSERSSLFCKWNGRGRRDAHSWSQKTPRVRGALYSASGMGEEEGTPIVGLRKHQEVKHRTHTQ